MHQSRREPKNFAHVQGCTILNIAILLAKNYLQTNIALGFCRVRICKMYMEAKITMEWGDFQRRRQQRWENKRLMLA